MDANAHILGELDRFRGKRNTVLTIFFPPDENFPKRLESIDRRISMIKHHAKRMQIKQVLDLVRLSLKEVHSLTFGGNGRILFAGFTNKNDAFFDELEPPNEVKKFEYWYDFMFHMDKVREIWYRDILFVPKEQDKANNILARIEQDVEDNIGTLLLGTNEIQGGMMMGIIKEFYVFTENSPDDYMLSKLRKIGAKVIWIRSKDMEEKYGPHIGISWFSVEE